MNFRTRQSAQIKLITNQLCLFNLIHLGLRSIPNHAFLYFHMVLEQNWMEARGPGPPIFAKKRSCFVGSVGRCRGPQLWCIARLMTSSEALYLMMKRLQPIQNYNLFISLQQALLLWDLGPGLYAVGGQHWATCSDFLLEQDNTLTTGFNLNVQLCTQLKYSDNHGRRYMRAIAGMRAT